MKKNNFNEDGTPCSENSNLKIEIKEDNLIPKDTILNKIGSYNKDKDESLTIDKSEVENNYEKNEKATKISIDDVGVKKQKETGRTSEKVKKEKREHVYSTVAHIENGDNIYYLNENNTLKILPIIIAFLFNNQLLNDPLIFFTDGARSLQNSINKYFSCFGSFRIILDWYHLKEKCKIQLSLGINGKNNRNEILTEILPFLWLGKINEAIMKLNKIDKSKIKDISHIERLIGYFERNMNYIPCYALRKELGLRVSSNRVEKSNDLIVSNRQKDNGMSWSKKGSVGIATLTTAIKNNEHMKWYKEGKIDFRLSA